MRQSELVTLNSTRLKPPKGVNRIVKKDKRGKVIAVHHYLREGGRIHGEPGSDEFLENYLRLQKGRVPKTEASLHGLVTEYLASRTDRRDALQQVVWALFTSSEFRFNH